jgi:hypothetical protein
MAIIVKKVSTTHITHPTKCLGRLEVYGISLCQAMSYPPSILTEAIGAFVATCIFVI